MRLLRRKEPSRTTEHEDLIDQDFERRWEEATPLGRVRIQADLASEIARREREKAAREGWERVRGRLDWHPGNLGAVAHLGSALDWIEPFQRDAHLAVLDSWLLPEVAKVRRDLAGLEAAVARMPHDVAAMLSPEVGVVSPVVWRWLRDAEHRRLVTPVRENPDVATLWDLTEQGMREVSRLQSSAILAFLKDTNKVGLVRTATGVGKAVAGAAVLVGGASVITPRDVPGWVTDIAVLVLVASAVVLLLVAAEDVWNWWQRSRRGPRGDTYQPEVKLRAPYVRVCVVREAAWQRTIAALDRRETPGFAPPDGWSPPPVSLEYDAEGRPVEAPGASETADR